MNKKTFFRYFYVVVFLVCFFFKGEFTLLSFIWAAFVVLAIKYWSWWGLVPRAFIVYTMFMSKLIPLDAISEHSTLVEDIFFFEENIYIYLFNQLLFYYSSAVQGLTFFKLLTFLLPGGLLIWDFGETLYGGCSVVIRPVDAQIIKGWKYKFPKPAFNFNQWTDVIQSECKTLRNRITPIIHNGTPPILAEY